MASTSANENDETTKVKLCSKSRKCSKQDKHSGRCNKERKFHAFWEASRVQVHNTLKRKFREANEQLISDFQAKSAKFADLEDREKRILERKSESEKLLQDAKDKVEEQLRDLELLKKEYDRFKIMLGQTQQATSTRIQNATNFDLITDSKNSTRYRRRQETKNVLEYIHGGEEAAVLGAWDVGVSYASKETMDQLIGSYKQGKHL
ncbi:uncharacterized protein LOC144658346 [Oculina patagonica]